MWLKKKNAATGPVAGPRSGCRFLGGLLWKLALATLLVYGALHVAVRTEVFRSRVEAELSRLAGMEMRVGRIRATESLNLRFRDVISVSEVAGIEARLVRIRWRLFRPRGTPMLESVRVDGLSLTLAPDSNGVLQPVFLGPVVGKVLKWAGAPLPAATVSAEKKGLKDEPGLQALRSGGPLVQLRGVSVRLQDAAGNLQASASGMELSWAGMELPQGGRVSHVNCRVAEVKVVNGPRITGWHVELVDVGGKQFLVDLDAADWGSAQKPLSMEEETRDLLDRMD